MANRAQVLEFISERLGIPVERLAGTTVVNHDCLIAECCGKFNKPFITNNMNSLTVDGLVRQLVD